MKAAPTMVKARQQAPKSVSHPIGRRRTNPTGLHQTIKCKYSPECTTRFRNESGYDLHLKNVHQDQDAWTRRDEEEKKTRLYDQAFGMYPCYFCGEIVRHPHDHYYSNHYGMIIHLHQYTG